MIRYVRRQGSYVVEDAGEHCPVAAWGCRVIAPCGPRAEGPSIVLNDLYVYMCEKVEDTLDFVEELKNAKNS